MDLPTFQRMAGQARLLTTAGRVKADPGGIYCRQAGALSRSRSGWNTLVGERVREAQPAGTPAPREAGEH